MLGKYMKHEFQETGKLMIPLNLVILAYTLIGAIMLGSRLFISPPMIILGVCSLVLYILSLFAIFIVAYVYFTVRFYKTMYTSQGYLTHTLPLSTMGIINTKVLVSSCWMILTVAVTTLSVIALVASAIGSEWGEIAFSDFSLYTGFSLTGFFAWYVLLLILGCVEQILMIYASLAIGQLVRQYRVLASIGTYIVFHMVLQIINVVILFVTQLFSVNIAFVSYQTDVVSSHFYERSFAISTIESTLLCILFYVLCYWLTNKKLNLE